MAVKVIIRRISDSILGIFILRFMLQIPKLHGKLLTCNHKEQELPCHRLFSVEAQRQTRVSLMATVSPMISNYG